MHVTSQTDQTVNLALFDFDGTLCTKDSFTGFIFYTLSKRHIVRQSFKILPWIQAYYLKLYPAHAMRVKLFNAMFQGNSAEQLQQLGHEYAHILLEQLNQKLLEQLVEHQNQGDTVALVSASIDLYLEPVCQLLGIDLICTEVEIKDGLLTGQYATPDCSSQQKKDRIQENYALQYYARIYAYGNSEEDLAMLSLADSPFMVGKDSDLPLIEAIKKRA